MIARTLEELQVYQKARVASQAISAMLDRHSFRGDQRLRTQLASASERVVSAIAEGFEQSTDRHFAQYCFRAKGSCREIRTQLSVARDRRYITEEERQRLDPLYEEVAKMLSGLIRHLKKEDRKDRGPGRWE
jgi:four helix bundle protein